MGMELDGAPENDQPIRVLHVDDDTAITEVTAANLETENPAIEVIPEHDPTAVMDHLASGSIDCIVSDYDMPDQSGLDLLESVREAYPDVPFVLFTGKGSEEVASEAISVGVDDYLQKSHGGEQYELLAARIENLVNERRARTAVSQREARFRSLFENIPDPAVIVEYRDDVPVVQAVNAAFEETFGITTDRARNESINELIVPPGDRAAAAEIDLAARAGEEIAREVQRITADGEVRDFLFRNATITPVEGETAAHFGVYTDITPLRERERELEVYEGIVNNAPDVIYALNEDLEFILVNDVLELVSGVPTTAFLGSHVTTFVDVGLLDEETLARGIDEIRPLLAGETDQARFEVTASVDGDEVVTENNVSAVLDETGEPYAVVNIVRDVTERRQREAQLRRQNARLEEFASVVSHDLRNPLNVAQGNVQLALETGDDEPLETADGALDRMAAFIDDLLTLARQGQTVEETGPVELATAARAAWQSVDTDGARLAVETDETISADDDRLQQVLANLFANAIEHGGDGVTVTLGTLPDGFYIEDDGVGLPGTEGEAVFEHGFTTTDGGTGFGLSIVRGIVEAHGWSIRALDAPGGGARFEITDVQRPG